MYKKIFVRNFTLLFLVFTFLVTPCSTIIAYSTTTASTYLQNHANNPWSTIALSITNPETVNSDYLKNISTSSALDLEAPILAITSLNKDPRNFGSVDYVAKLKTFYTSGQIGDVTILNDDIFGILALISSGESASDSVITDSKNFILDHQNTDGGWGFTPSSSSDSNTTASAIVALVATGMTQSNLQISNALNYLKISQNLDGGFTYDPLSSYGTDSDSSSTSWVLWALNALSINPSTWNKGDYTPVTYLESNQSPTGFFRYQSESTEDSFSAVTTAYAVIALSGKTLPTKIFTPNSSAQLFNFRIEGSTESICFGKTFGPSALDIVKNAAIQCGFTYSIQQLSFGPYLKQINSDSASGQTGWMYLVNNISPDVGASDYALKETDEVLWYFGDFGWSPTRLILDSEVVSSGQTSQATVQYFNNGQWTNLSAAIVSVGTANFDTNTLGIASLSNSDGYYKVTASKNGYVRSNQILLQIGQPSSSSLLLTANISGAQVEGTSTQPSTISFTINPGNLDFGTITKGASSSKQVTINNNGTVSLHIESIISGDSYFKDNLTINNQSWQNFNVDIGSKLSENATVKLSVPANFNGSLGQKNGELIFWATANN